MKAQTRTIFYHEKGIIANQCDIRCCLVLDNVCTSAGILVVESSKLSSKWSSRRLDYKQLLVYFILENNCSQQYVLANNEVIILAF